MNTNYKTIVSIPQWAQAMMEGEQGKLVTTADAYSTVSLVHRAIRLRCDALKRVPLYVNDMPSDDVDLEVYYPLGHKIGIKRFIWLLEASLLLRGGALSVALKNSLDIRRGIQFLNPFSVFAEWDDQKNTTRFYQQLDGKRYPTNKAFWYDGEDALWLREFDPDDDIGFGVSAASLVLDDAQMLYYLRRFAGRFFEGGAMPTTIVTVPGATPDKERDRIQNFFTRTMAGIANAWRVLAIRGDKEIVPQTITPDLSSMALPEVRNAAIDSVSWAFDIPRTMLTADAANYATANQDANGFLTNTIIPRCDYFTEELKRYGVELRFAPNEMNELQADENERATAASSYASMIAADPDAAMIAFSILGVDIPEDAQEMIDAYLAQKDSNRETMQENLQGAENDNQPVPNAEGEDTPQDDAEDDGEPARADAEKFMRKSLKALANGKCAAVSFESEHVDAVRVAALQGALQDATSADEVKAIFAAYEYETYPD